MGNTEAVSRMYELMAVTDKNVRRNLKEFRKKNKKGNAKK